MYEQLYKQLKDVLV